MFEDAETDIEDWGRPGIREGGGMAMEALETARLSPVDRPVVVGLLDMMAQRASDGNGKCDRWGK